MAARGKKRRRADGSIAGKPVQGGAGYRGPATYEELGAVLPATLAAAVDISRRYVPIDGSDPGDWDWEAEFDEIEIVAEREGVDRESLAVRAEKLLDFLRSPDGERFYKLHGDKLVIDRALLEHAATAWTDNSNKPLLWQPQDAEPEPAGNRSQTDNHRRPGRAAERGGPAERTLRLLAKASGPARLWPAWHTRTAGGQGGGWPPGPRARRPAGRPFARVRFGGRS